MRRLRGATRAMEVGRRGRRNRDFIVGMMGVVMKDSVVIDEMTGQDEEGRLYSPSGLVRIRQVEAGCTEADILTRKLAAILHVLQAMN